MRPPHKKAHATCEYGATTWGECDKARDNAYADWQAMQQVILAYNIVVGGRAKAFKKDDTQFGQLVQLINGDRDIFVNDDGNESRAPFIERLRAAIARFSAGDLPAYNLYEPVAPAER
jgi:hypothetical protein